MNAQQKYDQMAAKADMPRLNGYHELPPEDFDGRWQSFDDSDWAEVRPDSKAPEPEPEQHPLTKFVEFDLVPKAPRWVIPGFIGHGAVTIAGSHGVGKTTALLPLAMVAAGLHGPDDPLAPKQWRHVVYIVEELEQAQRILAGIVGFGQLGIALEQVRERLHIVEACRLKPRYVAKAGKAYKEQFSRVVDGVEILPLVVMDTKSAVFDLENENDNSEGSMAMAALKQDFCDLPVWLVGHVAKPNVGRSEVAALSMRGSTAFEADANQTLFLVKEQDETRYLIRGKTRFEARWPELRIDTHIAHTAVIDEFGFQDEVFMRWGTPVPPEQTRKQAQELAADQARKEAAEAMRDEVRDAVQIAWQAGNPLNREGVKAKLDRKREAVVTTIENLINERWLYEVMVPPRQRTNSRKAAFLVNLSTEEHEAFVSTGVPPQDKLVIPQSWRKPSVPEVSGQGPNLAGSEHV